MTLIGRISADSICENQLFLCLSASHLSPGKGLETDLMTHPIRERFLAVVAKRPAPGQTKTRLCPPLTGAEAAALYECFLADTLDVMRQVESVGRAVIYLPEEERGYFGELAPDFALHPQRGDDLGARLDNLLRDALAAGAKYAVVMDSDSPTLPVACLEDAYAHLAAGADVVFGPCDDGGYYLVGVTRPQPRLLRDVAMSTPTVLEDSLAIADELGLKVALLPTWYDVDTGAELERLQAELAQLPDTTARHTRRWLTERVEAVG
jgi:rSAM/selenodomain-associated transferase 1